MTCLLTKVLTTVNINEMSSLKGRSYFFWSTFVNPAASIASAVGLNRSEMLIKILNETHLNNIYKVVITCQCSTPQRPTAKILSW